MHFVFCHQPSLVLKFIISYILKQKEFIHTYVYDSCTYMDMHMHTQMCICVNIYDSHGEISITLPMKVIFFLPKTTPSYFLWSDWSCHMIILFWQWFMLLSWVLFPSKDSKHHPLHYCFFFIQNYVKLYSTWLILCWFQQFISVL